MDNPNGGTNADHIKALREMGADIPESDHEMPDDISYLWDIHRELRFYLVGNSKGLALASGNPLKIDDITQHYNHLTKNEINAIMSLDLTLERLTNGNS